MELLGDKELVRAIVDDYRTAPISERERALFAFVEKVNGQCHDIERADVERLHEAGWDDEAILDAVSVCGLFNYFNRLVDATGAHPLSDRGHAASGRRIARDGYLIP